MSRDDEVAIIEHRNFWVVMYIVGVINQSDVHYFDNLREAAEYACSLDRKKGYTEYGVRIFDKNYIRDHPEIFQNHENVLI
jgi:hypothetical protein